MEGFHHGVELHEANDMVEIVSHAPCCKVVEELFHHINFLYVRAPIALLFHGGARIYEHLMKIQVRNNQTVNLRYC